MLPRSVMSAPDGAVTVGNEVTSATIRIGTCVPARNSGTTAPIATLFAFMNALVAMAGIASTGAARGSSTNCPGTGVDGGGGETFTAEVSAQPGANVKVAESLVKCVGP